MIEKIDSILYARSSMPERMAIRGGEKEKRVPIDFIFYYMKTNSREILIDAGCDSLPGFEMKDFIRPDEALRKKGIDPDGITDLIITHAHHDHIDGAKYFRNATVYIQKEEYEEGKEYLLQNKKVITFDEEYSLFDGLKILKIGGHSAGSSVVQADFLKQKYLFCGDEVYIKRNFEEIIPSGEVFCLEKAKGFIQTYANSEYILMLFHEG